VEVPKTLIVTNDFPPRVGGVQRFVHALAGELPPDRVAVVAPASPGSAEFDAREPYEIVRGRTTFAWATPRTARRVREIARAVEAEVVLFGAPMPLATMGPRLARGGLPYLVLAHGLDYWLSLAPAAHRGMRHATSRATAVLACSRFVGRVVRTAVPDRIPVVVSPPGVDPERFRPDLETHDIRRDLGVGERRLVVCVSRLVPRKGQDVLIRSMREVRALVSDATLLIVGGGPDRRRLDRLASAAPAGSVVFTGEVGERDLPRYTAMGDVFAMPCRDRFAGLEVEGWGIVFVEAAACGLPVVAGDSGGAGETIVDGETGLLVDGTDTGSVAAAVGRLLADPAQSRRMGAAGRARVEAHLTWAHVADRLCGWLRVAAGGRG
jgi:phosphatidyl-myo-inositol dimannoside synthase